MLLIGSINEPFSLVDTENYYKVAICQGIRRYLQEPPYNRDIDIVTDMKLKKANDAFKRMLKKCRQEGKGVVQHKKSIQSGTFPFIMC